jgi:putative tricarboxylic transport membrane protein
MSNRLMGVAIFMVAALYLWQARGFQANFGDVLGPSVFPTMVGLLALLLSASMVVLPSGSVTWPERRRMARQAAALVVMVLYALFLGQLGFPIATFGLIAALAVLMGGPPLKSLAVGAALSIGLFVLFDRLLGLPLDALGSWFG